MNIDVKKILRQPYPLSVHGPFIENLKSTASFTIFIILINILSDLSLQYLEVTLLFALIMFLILLFNLSFVPKIFPKVFDEERWNVWKEASWILLQFICIGTGNYLFFVWMDIVEPGIHVYRTFMGSTLGVGIGPIIAFIIYDQNKLLRKSLKDAEQANSMLLKHNTKALSIQPIELTSPFSKKIVKLKEEDIIYFESKDNYVEINCSPGNDPANFMFRITLQHVEQQLKMNPEFFRCHRAFIINLKKVRKIDGNAQGLKLSMDDTDRMLPVSRRYISDFKSRL